MRVWIACGSHRASVAIRTRLKSGRKDTIDGLRALGDTFADPNQR